MGKSVSDVILDRFLRDVEEENAMPWQKPYTQYNAFNYFTLSPYRGINRLMLPFGEYMTANQIDAYNKANNEDYRFQKGIVWYPVVFYKTDVKEVSYKEVSDIFDIDINSLKEGDYIGHDGSWSYYKTSTGYQKRKGILRYFNVAERKHFKNSKGEVLPSRLETGEVEITLSRPREVVEDYLKREGIKVIDTGDIPCYNIVLDKIEMNNHCVSEDSWFSVMFHEMAHSTGSVKRLNRVGCRILKDVTEDERKEIYAKEECIAEMATCLCCAECGIYSFETSNTIEYQNNIAYVQSWKKRVKDWGKEFIFLASQADKAFNRIMNFSDEGE